MSNEYGMLIHGRIISDSLNNYEVRTPIDGKVIAHVPSASDLDVMNAVDAAKASLPSWKTLEPFKREKILWRWAELIEHRADDLGALAALEGGHSTKARTAGFRNYSDFVRFVSGFASREYGRVLQTNDRLVNYVVREPVGVAAIFPAWNTVGLGAILKSTPALAAGCSVVVRAPAHAPLSTMVLAETVLEAGFPPGVINIVSGPDRKCSQALINNPDVRVISYTGGFEVGKYIMKQASTQLKRVAFELGGKSPFIVYPDADLEEAARNAVHYAFLYQGQICSSPSRIFIHTSIRDWFTKRVVELTKEYKPGHPDSNVDYPIIGPLFNEARYKEVDYYVCEGRKTGNVLIGGNRIETGDYGKAYYYEPTIFEFENDRNPVCKEEIFGPVTALIPFETEDEVHGMVNDVPYGLSASIWTKDLEQANRSVKNIEAGTIWVNNQNQWGHHGPWGGMKSSGLGREMGRFALEDYLEYKNVWLNP